MWLTIYLAALGGLAIYAGHRTVLTAVYWKTRRSKREPLTPANTAIPNITVQLPVFNERFVVRRLIEAAANLKWPKDHLQIQVLDDSTDETIKVCEHECARFRQLGVNIEHVHRTNRVGFKAGALAAGTATATGEYILILDADFVPLPNLLEKMAPHFADDRVGMIQVRWEHLNRGESMLTEVQALLLDGHFGVEQTARSQSGRFFNFNGTAGMWRREAIADAGGWQHDTLTEDLDLSYRALLAGWEFRYLPDVVAPAELPAAMRGFKTQQFRWAKGSIQVARKLLWRVLRAPIPLRSRIEGFFHLTQNVPYLLTAILAVSAVPALALGARPSGWAFIALDLALLIGTVGTLALYCLSAEAALGKRVFSAFARLPALIAVTAGISLNQTRAVLEGAFGTESGFVRTPKAGDQVYQPNALSPPSYRSRTDLLWFAEILLAVYFCLGALVAISSGRWLALPALAIFAAGFSYVGTRTAFGR